MLTDAELAATLPLSAWGVADARAEPLGGGMNSATALVATSNTRYVAKWVPHDRHAELLAGAEVAALLAARGLVTGPPVPALDGAHVVPHALGWCTLSAFVPGVPLTGDTDADQRAMATVLAAAHRAGGAEPTGAFAAWLRSDLPGLDVEPWVRPAVTHAVAALASPAGLTHARLHSDPAPEAFRREGDVVGLIDWTGSEVGPVLYDVASAVMYLGGPDEAAVFVQTYAELGPLEEDELARLDTLRRFRWAVQAAYFASRIVADDRTGTDAAGNRKGLADARRGLGG